MSGQIVPAVDLAPDAGSHGGVLANIEAEAALLGCVLADNSAFERVDDDFHEEQFFEPLHGRIWAAISRCVLAGKLAEPILIESQFRQDPAFAQLGGIRYLADLILRAPPPPNARDYAEAITDMWRRRRMVEIAAEANKGAHDFTISSKEALERAEGEMFSLGESRAAQGFVSFSEALAGAVGMAAEAYERDGSLSGLSTGLIDLDQKIGGLHPSDLIILAARPSMGKTALACNIAFDVAKNYFWEPQADGSRKTAKGGIVAFFSLEMSADQLALRILAEVSGVPGDRLRKGEVEAHEFGRVRDAALMIQEAPLYIDATGGISVGKIWTRARRLKRTVGLDLVIVDYLQLASGNKRYEGGQRVQEVSEITTTLKAMAKDLNVPVIALSQLSREVEKRPDKKPQLADLRESGSIEQDADMVMFVYRASYYLEREEPDTGTPEHFEWQTKMDEVRGLAEIIIGKQRHGPIGTVRLAFNEDLTKFGNLARRGTVEYGQARLPHTDS